MKVHTRKTTTSTSRRKRRQNSSVFYSSFSSSSTTLNRAMMTLLVLFFGTLFADDVFVVVRATWPIVRYKNGTVGVKNDGGAVQVQSTDLLVDGNLSVSGSLFVQDRDLAEYVDRVSSLENAKYEDRMAYLESTIQSHASALAGMSGSSATPPKCIPPGGDKLRFDGEKWICVCINSYYYGDECQYKTPYEPVSNGKGALQQAIHSCLSAAPIHGLCYNSPHGPMPEWNISLVTSMYKAFYVPQYCCTNAEYETCYYSNTYNCYYWAQHNPDISKWDTSSVTDMSFAFQGYDDNRNKFCNQFNQNISQWDTSKVLYMRGMFYQACAFNHYVGDWDTSSLTSSRYDMIFYGADAFQAKYTCASSSSYSVKPSSCKTVRSTWIAPPPPPSPPLPPPPPPPPPSNSVTINGKQLYRDTDGWILLLAYKHKAGENNALVSQTAPSSPTEGYSHVWLEDLGLTASDVESVKFYCKTSAHSRVMHFSSSTDWVKNAVVTGTYTGNQVSYWTSGTTKFDDHTANLPDAADFAAYNELTNAIFYVGNTYHWGMKIQGSRWECDDMSFNTADTLHQIWFKRKLSGTYAVTIDGVSTDIYHDHETAGGGWMSFASVPSTGGFFGGDTGNADWSTSSYSYGTYDASGAVGDYWRDISKQSVSEILFKTGDGMYWIVMKLSDISTTGDKTLVASSGNFEESKEENTKAYVLRRSSQPEDPWINAGNSHNGGVGAQYIVNYMFWGEAGYDADYGHASFKNDHGGVLVFVR